MLATATGHHEVVGSSVSIHSNGQIGCGSLVYLNRFNAGAVITNFHIAADIESNCSRRLSVQTAKRENVKISRWLVCDTPQVDIAIGILDNSTDFQLLNITTRDG